MEALVAYSDEPQIYGQAIPRPHLPDKMGVVFEIHRPRFPAAMVGIAKSDRRIELVARVVEHHDKIPDVHMLVAVGPIGARYGLVTGRSQFLNLFRSQMRGLHRPHRSVKAVMLDPSSRSQ